MRAVKLVRSELGRALADGSHVTYRPVLDRAEHVHLLRKKLGEEVAEYLTDPSVDELADLYGVLMALAYVELGVPFSQVVDAEIRKQERKGNLIDGVAMTVTQLGRSD